MWWGVLAVSVALILILAIISTYNGLVKARNRVKNSWSQIDVQLKRRFDLIPNLVETAKGYAAHEKGIFDEFAKARNAFSQANNQGDVQKMAQANDALGGVLTRLMAVSESYPDLKADKNFGKLMDELKTTEDKIAYSRQFYNDVVLTFNNLREVFPKNIVANMFNFEKADLFKINESEKENVTVSFS